MHGRRWIRLHLALLACAAIVVLDLFALSFEPVRALAVRAIAASALSLKGFHLEHADVYVDRHRLALEHVSITEKPNLPFFTADTIDVRYELHGIHLDSADVRIDRPHLFLRRQKDGTYNIQRLTGGSVANPASPNQPSTRGSFLPSTLRLSLALVNGQVDLENAFAPGRPGRHFSLGALRATAYIDPGSVSTGSFRGDIITNARTAPLKGTFLEDDRTRFAALRASATGVPLAPVLDLIVSSPAFIVDEGIADFSLNGYALQWSSAGPQWHVLGRGAFRSGRINVTPLAVAARNAHGPLAFNDGVLFLPSIAASASGLPVKAHGSIDLVGGPTISLSVSTAGTLSRARNLFSFSRAMPLHGNVAALAKVTGSLTDPLVAASAMFVHGLSYGTMPIESAIVSLAYFHNHLTFPMIAARYQAFSVYGDGDIFVPSTTQPPRGQFILALRGPSKNIPWLANVEDRGVLTAHAALEGPLAQLNGYGFVRLQGPGQTVRSSFSATGAAFTFGPMLANQSRGGSLWIAGTVDRGDRQAHGDLVADRFILALNPRRVALPGVIDRAYGSPQVGAVLTGGARMDGEVRAPQFDLGLQMRRLAVAGSPVGDINVAGIGQGGLAWLRVSGPAARVAGIPFHDANLLAGLDHAGLHIYSASADVAGGRVALVGDLQIAPGRASQQHELFALASNVDLADLRGLGLPVSIGQINAMGSLRGSTNRPQLALSAQLANSDLNGTPLSGDGQLAYRGSTLTLGQSRIMLGSGSEVTASGVVRDVVDPASLRAGRLDVNASTTEADISDLAGQSLPIAGTVDANLHLGGTVSSPSVAGSVDSPAGTVRGVPYRDLGGALNAEYGALALRGGHITIGSSSIDASGSLSAAAAQVQLSSRHIDLSDFNDFFQGSDVFEGSGAMRLALDTSHGSPSADGLARFRDLAVMGIPLDQLQAGIRTQHGTILADVRQSGAIAHTHLQTAITLPANAAGLAQLGRAAYRISADSNDIDVAMLSPFLPAAAEGVRGRLSIDAVASGPLQHLDAGARFALHNGFMRKDPINALSGDVADNGRSLRVNAFHLNVSDVDVNVRGTYERNGAIAVHGLLQTRSLATVARLAHFPHVVTGRAALAFDASGTVQRPRLQALITADQGSAYGVQYQHVAVNSLYAPGSIDVRTASVQFPSQAGTIVASGTAPVAYGPQPLDPPGQPLKPIPLDVHVRTAGLDLSVFNPLLAPRASLGGKLDFAASATGSLQRPTLAGYAFVRKGTVNSRYETVPLTGLDVDLAFNNTSIALKRLQGVLGKGSIDARGIARLIPSGRNSGGPGALAYSATLNARNANLAVPNFFSGVLNSDLSLHSGPPVARLAGTVAISDSSIPFVGILALASGRSSGPAQSAVVPGVPPLRKGHTVAYAGSVYGPDVQYEQPTPTPTKLIPRRALQTTPVELDVNAVAGKNVQTTGLINVTGAGTVHVGGTATAPVLAGGIDLLRGQVSLFDTTFDLQRGRVAFHPRDGLLPTVNVAAAAYRPEAEVTVVVFGRVDQLHTDIESDPPMTQDQILANILHIGDINTALSGGGTGQPLNGGAMAENFVVSEATAPLFAALNYGLEQALNIEEFNLAIGPNGSPLLELRKRWGKNVYVLFREGLGTPPQQIYGLSYNVRNNLEVDLEQAENPPGTIGQNGLQPIWQTTLQATAHFDTNRHKRTPKKAHATSSASEK